MRLRKATLALGAAAVAVGSFGAIPALGLGHVETFVFLAAMVAGIVIGRTMRGALGRPAIA